MRGLSTNFGLAASVLALDLVHGDLGFGDTGLSVPRTLSVLGLAERCLDDRCLTGPDSFGM